MNHVHDIGFHYDILFESNMLVLVIYVYVVARSSIHHNAKIKYGFFILLFTKTYDLASEIAFIDNITDQYELIDTLLDDGLLQLSLLLIALGITELTQNLSKQSRIDELTGLYNRKKLTDIKLPEFDLIYMDLNDLKLVNDTDGHESGDLLIARFAQVLKQTCGDDEMAFRVGGDEFVVTVKPSSGHQFIERVTNFLESDNISFSFGIQSTTKENFHDALRKSDQAMYEMKKANKPNSESKHL